MEDAERLRKEIAHDRLKSYYFTGKPATQEEMKEAIERVKEHMRSMKPEDFMPADEYFELIRSKHDSTL